MAKRAGLGKGLEALKPNSTTVETISQVVKTNEEEILQKVRDIDIGLIEANPNQPRKFFDQEALDDLASSIKQVGVLQPLVVVKKDTKYIIVSGERRFRASILAGLKKVPAAVMDLNDNQISEIAIIENIQRENLSALEEAKAYQDLIYNFGYTQDEVAKRVGKNRATVANALRLLKLPEEMQQAISENILSAGHARSILALKKEADKKILFKKIIDDGISVREAERFVAEANGEQIEKKVKTVSTKAAVTKDVHLKEIENKLIEFFGTKVAIVGDLTKGNIKIEYYSMDDLNRIYEILDK